MKNLPMLAMNRRFVQAVLAAPGPCCALGMIESGGETFGLVALRPDVVVPEAVSQAGFEFGHRVLGGPDHEVVQLSFEFRGFETFHVLLNPSSPVVRQVLEQMIDSGDYFVLVLGAESSVQVFRSDIDQESLIWLQAFLPRLIASRTSAEQYRRVLAAFRRRPQPPGLVLAWTCGDDVTLLDLGGDRVELKGGVDGATG
jgi:hypothetical protein